MPRLLIEVKYLYIQSMIRCPPGQLEHPMSKVKKITKDNNHPSHNLFTPLSARR
jgi:hypothetical protein